MNTITPDPTTMTSSSATLTTDLLEDGIATSTTNDKVGFVIDEITTLRQDLARIEERLNFFETGGADGSNRTFDPDDVRYSRLLEEKKFLLSHLCELRMQVIQSGQCGPIIRRYPTAPLSSSVSSASGSSKRLRSPSPTPASPQSNKIQMITPVKGERDNWFSLSV